MKWVAEGVFSFVFLFFLYYWRRGRNTEEPATVTHNPVHT